MQAPMMKFLGWDKPAVDLVADELLAGLQNQESAAAFRRATVVVPTAESGRRLRERIAELAGKPVLIPEVRQPVHLVHVTGAADELVELAAWVRVLGSSRAEENWPALFPVPPVSRQNWSLGMARQLQQLRRRLDDACLTPARIAADSDDEHEAARWQELEQIFQQHDTCLAEWGYKPAAVCYAAALRESLDYYAGRTIIVACLPQLTARFRLFLDAVLAAGGRVLVWVNASARYAALFDSRYGTPLADWATESIAIDDAALAVVPDGAGMARLALRECEGQDSCRMVLGCADASFAPVLRNAFDYAGWVLNVPESRSFMSTETGQWSAALQRALAQPDSVVMCEQLLRNETMLRSAGLKPEQRFRFNTWLDCELREQLPASVKKLQADARAYAAGHRGFSFLVSYLKFTFEMVSRLKSPDSVPEALRQLAAAVVAGYKGGALSSGIETFAGMMQQVAALLEQVPELGDASVGLNMLQSCAQVNLNLATSARENTALDASGWMELPYCSGDKLVLCGLHEHCVPEPPSVDAFLPESLCRRYPQLSSMAQRVARDSFMLHALLSAYRGNLRIIVARQSDDGTPVVPSQLLLRCPAAPPELLIRRVDALFRELPPISVDPVPGVWRMHTPVQMLPGLEDISLLGEAAQNPWPSRKDYFSPSTLAAFLACPLRFWLNVALGMDPQDTYDAGKTALDAMEYGTLMHAALEALVRRYPVHDATVTREMMQEDAKACIQEQFARYGSKLSLPLVAQRRMMEHNLALFVDKHLADLAAGWEVVHLEYKTEQSGWKLDGTIPFRMTLDRVDRQPKGDGTYRWRIIDYKTGSSKPVEKHLGKVTSDTASRFAQFLPELPLLPMEKKETVELYRWKEVQLPLYAQWLMDAYSVPLEDMEVAYYLMPRNKKSCDYAAWTLTAEMQESALLWVRRAVEMILSGRCLVSAESLGLTAYADFGALSPEGDPRLMMGLPELTLAPTTEEP